MTASSNIFPLENKVETDEFLVGGIEEGKKGRSHGKKSLVLLGVEKVIDRIGKEKLGHAYTRVIESSSA